MDVDVAAVDHLEDAVRVDAELHVRPLRRRADVLGLTDRPRPEARARPVRDALVERGAEDDDIGARVARRVELERQTGVRQADAGEAGLVGAVRLHGVGCYSGRTNSVAGFSGPQMSSSISSVKPRPR